MNSTDRTPARATTAAARGRPHRALALAAGLAASVAVAIMTATAAAAETHRTPAMSEMAGERDVPRSFSALAKKLVPAVVNLSTTKEIEVSQLPFPQGSPFEQFFEEYFGGQIPRGKREVTALGSGFIIDPDGFIVTNNHVVAETEKIKVILHDERTYEAKIVGRDPLTDLALIKIDAEKELPSVVWGDSDAAEVGDWMIAVGNPFGLGGSVTVGILSARARNLRAGPYAEFLQTDASINRGNSGGPLFNARGRAVGVNSAIISPTGGNIGIGFAVPAAIAKPVIEQLREKGEVDRGWIGVEIQPVTPGIAKSLGLAEPRGALVADVREGGPAARAGIRSGDVILGFAGEQVAEIQDLPQMVANAEIGSTVEVTVWREGERRTFEVSVGELNLERMRAAKVAPERERKGGEPAAGLGIQVAPLTEEMRARFGIEAKEGVIVVAVRPGSVAAERGLRPGDVIVEAGGERVASPDELVDRLARARQTGRESVLLRVRRDGRQRYLAVPA